MTGTDFMSYLYSRGKVDVEPWLSLDASLVKRFYFPFSHN